MASAEELQHQLKVAAIVPKVSGSLSVLGDIYIIYDILSDRKKWTTSYHRIMLGMSIVDFMVSAIYIWSSWAVPADINPEYGVFQPYGNTHTCNFQGFIIQFGIAAPMYNLSLCFYYYVVIVYGWKEFQVKKLEMTMHVFSLVVGLVTAIIGLVMEQYNNYLMQCWIHGAPFECEFVPEVECERGHHANLYRLTMYTIPLWSFQIIATAALASVFYHVDAQEKRANKWRQNTKKKKKGRLTREVSWQSFWYLLAFYITWIPATVGGIMELAGIPPTFAGLIATFATMPAQGFSNCLIYVRPRYIRWVKKHPQFSVWLKFKKCYKPVKRILLGKRTTDDDSDNGTQADQMAWMASSIDGSKELSADFEDPNVRILYEGNGGDASVDNKSEMRTDIQNVKESSELHISAEQNIAEIPVECK